MMETTMYEDNGRQSLKNIKSNMTLDFSGPKTKQQKFVGGQLLSSPDLGLLKLASPELERMIIQQNGMVTTTPTPTQFLFPKSVSEEQEAYARGFVDALAELHTKPKNGEASQSTTQTIPTTGSTVLSVAPQSRSQPQQTQASQYTTLTTVTVPQVSAASQPQASFATTTPLPGSVVATSATSQNVMTSGTYLTQHQQLNSLVSQANPVSRTQSPLVHMPAVTSSSAVLPQGTSTRLMQLKEEEPQTVPCLGNTPPLSPIDMESQERIKLERKRARNRVAARKCRTRKLERISRLEDRVSDLKTQNSDLTHTATALREQVYKLKQQIMEHVNSGCQVMLSPNLV